MENLNLRCNWSITLQPTFIYLQEIASLQTVIELRGGENRQLREENNKLKNKLEDHHWLETELGKAKHRLEELTVIVQNKMVSERYVENQTSIVPFFAFRRKARNNLFFSSSFLLFF